LLYVALTRAEDRLYICGYHGVREPTEDCWYKLVESAFPADAAEVPFDGELTAKRLAHAQEAVHEKEKQHKAKTDAVRTALPAWVGQSLPDEPQPSQPLAPSRPDDDEPAMKGPLVADDGWRFRRGIILHQILEVLPQLSAAKWETAIAHYLARPALAMPPAQQKSFAAEILAVLRHPEFAAIFGPGSRAEVPVTGQVGKKTLSGQMDRMLVTDKEVLIIDYKTNRPPPRVVKDVAAIYLKQMAAYRSVIQNIYPQHAIKCALLWTDGPLLMPLPANLLDPYAL
jgi:ATP-dependent helicase/nuclease subunit A